ncbi:TROVE domain-containing protein [Rufibacter roseus]|uniref:TROVE domain-containing protein n=1 Tax=Rufibacter roseus TaxID=1567108 RepID=A0ABW2DQK9_9BACT|nr:TROVE domain-containing protein [Rufibacter roseus]
MRFNFFKPKTKATEADTLNYEGALAWKMDPKAELYAATVTASLQNTFYQTAGARLERLQELVAQNEPEFVAKLAVYARTKMNLRSVPLVLLVELAHRHRGDNLVSRAVAQTLQRVDEITELLAYYQLRNGRQGTKKLNRLSKQLQRGVALAFNRFDAYQFAKYNRAAEVKLRDALFLVHPQPKDQRQQAVFHQIASNTLPTPYTWETELSALGQQPFADKEARDQAFRAKWEELIDSGRLGYMALLRNLRNILEAQVSDAHIRKVCQTLASPLAVQKAKQLPFRFLAAYREVKGLASADVSRVLSALEEAVQHSIRNLPGFSGEQKVVVACDVSGSMQMPVSARSKVMLYDIGLLLGMLLQHKCERVISGMFGDTWKTINLPKGQVLANVQELYRKAGEVGYSTNGFLVIKDLRQRKVKADKIMLFTDCQLWNSTGNNTSLAHEWKQYKALYPCARLYLFDLAGHGTTPLSLEQDDVFLISGWSDKVFEVLQAIENGGNALAEVEKTEID